MLNTEQDQDLFVEEDSTQTVTEETPIFDDEKKRNAFQTIERKYKAERDRAKKLELELNELKLGKKPDEPKPLEKPEASNVPEYLNKIKNLEEKLDLIINHTQKQDSVEKEKKLTQVLDNFGKKLNLSKNEIKSFFNGLKTEGTPFTNDFEGKKQYALSLVNYPEWLETQIMKGSPTEYNKAVERFNKKQEKAIYKANTATVRSGQYATNYSEHSNGKKNAQEIVKQYLDNKQPTTKLQIIGKAH